MKKKKNEPMIIQLTNDYRIVNEGNLNFTLQKLQDTKIDRQTKEEVSCEIWNDIGYYGSVENCIKSVLRRFKDCNCNDLVSYQERQESLLEEIKRTANDILVGIKRSDKQ